MHGFESTEYNMRTDRMVMECKKEVRPLMALILRWQLECQLRIMRLIFERPAPIQRDVTGLPPIRLVTHTKACMCAHDKLYGKRLTMP